MHKLPPLRAMQVFDAAARHQCFSLAAVELMITQGAVSKQIKLLEEFYAEALFVRRGTVVGLTSKGRWLARELVPVFDHLYGISHFSNEPTGKIRIATYPSFSTRQLIYQVEQFNQQYPNIDVELVLTISHPELCDDVADLFITVAEHTEGYDYQWLFAEQLIAVASPNIINAGERLTAADLTGFTLLIADDHMGSDWQRWFQYHDLHPAKYQKTRTFNHVLLTTEAAERGHGIALSCQVAVSRDIIDGRLCNTGLPPAPSGLNYYLCCKSRRRHEPNIKLFSHWLKRQLQSI